MPGPRDVKDAEVDERRQMAGRIGFSMGCIAALVAAAINFVRAPRPLSAGISVLIVLVAALNIPLGIAIGLLGERVTRHAVRKP
jgi:carbamate kinase